MSKEIITVFHANQSSTIKLPLSPFGDKTFIFENYAVETNLDMFKIMVSNFILNIPLGKMKDPIRTYRRKVNLEPFYDSSITYFVIDIDEVKSEESKKAILKYFKDYKCILGESKSYNGISNFNMKGLLFTENIDIADAKLALSKIHHDLKKFAVIDESVVRKASLNAPIKKSNIFLNNEGGFRFKFVKQEAIEKINEIKKEYQNSDTGFDMDVSGIESLKSIEADSMEKLCLKVFQTMGFSATKNNENGSISFKHPEEVKSPGGYFWFDSSPYTMHHGNSTKTINIFESVRKLPLARELMQKNIDYDNEFLEFNTETNVITVNEKYLEVTPEVEAAVASFIDKPDGLFSIRSPMGTGKSTVISEIIEECHEQDLRVLIITNRISVAKDFGKKYNIKVYNVDKYEMNDSLICQFDSLWKYNVKYFDVVVMDEFISLMGHARSNLNHSSVNIAKFFACFKKKIVLADAFLTGFENFLLQDKESNIHLLDNIYRDPTTLYSYDDYNYFVSSLVYHADKHKVTVSGTSLSFIHSLQALLTKRGKKVVTLTADTPDSTKELIYGLFEESEHDKWDVLIFSPTLTVGVSNLNNVPYHFHYDSSQSTDVISSIQMIKRTRKTKEIHMHIKERTNYIKTTYNDIRDEYMMNIGRNAGQNYLFDIDDYGETKLSEIGKKAIKIDTFKNILEFNHKEGMLWLLKYHFLHEPRVVDQKFSGNILYRYQKEIRDDKQSVLQMNVKQFLSLSNLEKTEVLMDSTAGKTMKVLAELDSSLDTQCPEIARQQILEIALKDRQFFKKCVYYKAAFNFTKQIWDASDVKVLVSKSVQNQETDDLHFWNTLLNYGQNEIFDEYLPKFVNDKKQLKYILDKCGYRVTGKKVIGQRAYSVDENVKRLYGYVKN